MSVELTIEEQVCNYHQMRHIHLLGRLIHMVIADLMRRADNHDRSKLSPPEVAAFAKVHANQAGTTYGSKEYASVLDNELKVALQHHYASNPHHPEYYANGIEDMTLVDLIEMFCDWKASSTKHHDGNIRKSIAKNAARFNINPQLVKIFENTAVMFDNVSAD